MPPKRQQMYLSIFRQPEPEIDFPSKYLEVISCLIKSRLWI
jgi:hypothetical protein